MGRGPQVSFLTALKYQSLGNDFLVVLDPAPLEAAPAGIAGAVSHLCERRRGLGADGVVIARRPSPGGGADFAMELRNADGGRAETSGNGLRCLALALGDEGVAGPGPVVIETDRATSRATFLRRLDGATAEVSVTMGTARVGQLEESVGLLEGGFEARRVDVGNPHLVLLCRDLEKVEIEALGGLLSPAVPGGQNVEAVAPSGEGGLAMLVYERGVGRTEACGSGSCAAAAAARASGLVGDEVGVANPGGLLTVRLSGTLGTPDVELSGPVSRVARVEVDAAALAPAGRGPGERARSGRGGGRRRA